MTFHVDISWVVTIGLGIVLGYLVLAIIRKYFP